MKNNWMRLCNNKIWSFLSRNSYFIEETGMCRIRTEVEGKNALGTPKVEERIPKRDETRLS